MTQHGKLGRLDRLELTLKRQGDLIDALVKEVNTRAEFYAHVAKFSEAQIATHQHLVGRSIAATAVLKCLIASHPAPNVVLEALLAEMDALGDLKLDPLTHIAASFSEYVSLLSGPRGGHSGHTAARPDHGRQG